MTSTQTKETALADWTKNPALADFVRRARRGEPVVTDEDRRLDLLEERRALNRERSRLSHWKRRERERARRKRGQ